MNMPFSSTYRIFRKDLKMKSYKRTAKPLLKDEHKAQRKKFTNWARKKVPERGDNENRFFSDEKMFDFDDIYNSENDRVRAVNREEAYRRDGTNSKESLQKK